MESDFMSVSGDLPISRDLLYLAFIFLGGSIGCFLNRLRADVESRFRSRMVTLGLLLLSMSVAISAVMLILANGKIITDRFYYMTAFFFCIVSAVCFRFPKAAGFPVIIFAGIVFVWFAWSFTQFPRFDDAQRYIGSADFNGDQITINAVPDHSEVTARLSGAPGFELTVTTIRYTDYAPLIGGQTRGKITSMRGETPYFTDPRFEKGLLNILLKINVFGHAPVNKKKIDFYSDDLLPGGTSLRFYISNNVISVR